MANLSMHEIFFQENQYDQPTWPCSKRGSHSEARFILLAREQRIPRSHSCAESAKTGRSTQSPARCSEASRFSSKQTTGLLSACVKISCKEINYFNSKIVHKLCHILSKDIILKI